MTTLQDSTRPLTQGTLGGRGGPRKPKVDCEMTNWTASKWVKVGTIENLHTEINHGDRPTIVIMTENCTSIVDGNLFYDPQSAASDEKVAWKMGQSATSLRRPSAFRGEKFGI